MGNAESEDEVDEEIPPHIRYATTAPVFKLKEPGARVKEKPLCRSRVVFFHIVEAASRLLYDSREAHERLLGKMKRPKQKRSYAMKHDASFYGELILGSTPIVVAADNAKLHSLSGEFMLSHIFRVFRRGSVKSSPATTSSSSSSSSSSEEDKENVVISDEMETCYTFGIGVILRVVNKERKELCESIFLEDFASVHFLVQKLKEEIKKLLRTWLGKLDWEAGKRRRKHFRRDKSWFHSMHLPFHYLVSRFRVCVEAFFNAKRLEVMAVPPRRGKVPLRIQNGGGSATFASFRMSFLKLFSLLHPRDRRVNNRTNISPEMIRFRKFLFSFFTLYFLYFHEKADVNRWIITGSNLLFIQNCLNCLHCLFIFTSEWGFSASRPRAKRESHTFSQLTSNYCPLFRMTAIPKNREFLESALNYIQFCLESKKESNEMTIVIVDGDEWMCNLIKGTKKVPLGADESPLVELAFEEFVEVSPFVSSMFLKLKDLLEIGMSNAACEEFLQNSMAEMRIVSELAMSGDPKKGSVHPLLKKSTSSTSSAQRAEKEKTRQK